MDRVNRSLLYASTLLAVPVALLMATLTMGTTPDVQLAVVYGETDGSVQQVVGKQIESRPSSPGLLQAISGSQSGSSNHRHHHHQHQSSPPKPKGLLDGLFESGSNRSTAHRPATAHRPNTTTPRRTISAPGAPSQSTHSQSTHSHSQPSTHRPSVDWDGVPYHQAHSSTTHGTSKAPTRDPAPVTASSAPKTRIIRGGSTRPVPARTASVRRSQGPTVAREPAPALPAPSAKRIQPINRTTQSLSASSSTSSRRSDRRSVGALDASEIAAASRRPLAKSELKPLDDEVELIPRVARKELEVEESQSKESTPSKHVAENASQVDSTADAAIAQPEPNSDDASIDPEKNTALAAIGAPQATTAEPESAADVAESPAPSTSDVTPEPVYTTPVDPATNPVPVAGIPSHPYAASTPAGSTPAATASHRAGPPADAFGSADIDGSPRLVPGPQPHFNAASTPVGSGVVPNSDVASYRRPATPNLQPLPTTGNPRVDPYAHDNAPRLSTNGQLVAGNAPAPQVAPPSTAIPMHPIHGHGQQQATGLNQAADNFARSTHQSRNQMRDPGSGMPLSGNAVASELPGIRVVTHGPSDIMIRQTNQYEIQVENRGSIDAKGLMIRTTVPDWADLRGQNATRGDIDTQTLGSTERLVWTIDHLPAGASEQMFVRLTAERSGTYDLDVDWTLLPQKSVAKVQVREPRLDLTIEGPDEVIYGQSQTYKVRVLNPGDGTAPNVIFTLSPNSATPQTQRIGDIPPGKEAQFDVELTAQDLGDLKIHGLAAGDLELRAESAKTIRVAAAQLEAVLSGPELKYQDTEAMYNLQVQNTGAATSEKIVATLRIPSGCKYLGGLDDALMQGNTLKWNINALAPGASRNYQFRCKMASTGEHLFAFDCRGTAAGNAGVSIATRVESIADLVLTVVDPTAPAPIGSEVTYEIIVRNRGSKEATDVRAVAQFSHGIEPRRIEGQSGEVVTGQVLFDAIPRIGAGQEVRMRVIAEAEKPGHHRFRTEVRSGDTVLVAEEATHYMSPKSERVSRRSTDNASR